MANVLKGCVDVPHGEVHFRYGGRGPVVVLLHDSPRSSAQHVPNIEWLGEHCTVLALDLPGNGLSSPLPIDQPGIPDYSRALAQSLTALGIERCAVYGYHTSSKIALQFAVDHPERAALTILDGLALPVDLPDEDYLARYLQPIAPTVEGDYLVRHWTRILDAHRYFPWFKLQAEARLPLPLPDDRALHDYATDVLMAPEHGSAAHGAALRYAALPVIPRLRSPTLLMCRQGDVLFSHLDRLPLALPNGCRVARVPDGHGAWRNQLLAALRDQPASDEQWCPPAASTTSVHWQRHRYVNLLHGQMRIGLRGASSSETPVLFLHDLPGAPGQMDGLAAEIATDRLVLTPELPGLGESDPLPSPTLGAYVAVLEDALQALDCDRVNIVAEGLGTAFACALAANRPQRVRRVILDGVPMIRRRDRRRYVRSYCPPMTPDRAGTHLLRFWEQLRSAQMSWPWFDGTPAAARVHTPEFDARAMHAALVDAMKQPDTYGDAARAALDASLRDIVKAIERPVLAFQDAKDVRYAGTGSLKRRLAEGTVRARPEALASRSAACRDFLA